MLAIALGAITGATDAMSVLGLGGVFTSVMTANMVFLGVSAGQQDASLALHVGTVFAAFVVTTLIATRLLPVSGEPRPLWPRRVTAALAAEGAVLTAVTAGWEITAARPHGGVQYLLLAGAAVAMGIQGAAIRALGVPNLSTTYLTGLLTTVLASIATGHDPVTRRRGLLILLGLIAGAAGSSALFREVPRLVPVLPLALLAGVVGGSVRLWPRGEPGPAG